MLKNDLIEIVKKLYPDMKSLTAKTKDQLIKLITDADPEKALNLIKKGGYILDNINITGGDSDNQDNSTSESESDNEDNTSISDENSDTDKESEKTPEPETDENEDDDGGDSEKGGGLLNKDNNADTKIIII